MSDGTQRDYAEDLNRAALDGWARANGVRFVEASAERVVAEMPIGPQHLQPYGIVHGGMHAGLIETVASVGAALHALPAGRNVVGLENHTTFVRAAREGTIRVEGRPLLRGSRSQVWEASVTDDQGRLLATGRVRLLAIEKGAPIGGKST